MNENLDQELVKRGLLSFQGKIRTIVPDFSGNMIAFSSFDPTLSPVPPENLFFSPTQFKNSIFEMSNNRVIHYKSFRMLSLTLSYPGGGG